MSRLDELDPEFRKKVERLLYSAQVVTGRKWICVDGLRTMEKQRDLYAQGRTAPGKVVTNAQEGQSAHNFGLGADVAPLDEKGLNVDWGAPRSLWEAMANQAKDVGLTPGFYFHSIFDAPHVEDPRWKEMQADWIAGKIHLA